MLLIIRMNEVGARATIRIILLYTGWLWPQEVGREEGENGGECHRVGRRPQLRGLDLGHPSYRRQIPTLAVIDAINSVVPMAALGELTVRLRSARGGGERPIRAERHRSA
jgi:hypothetical protein